MNIVIVGGGTAGWLAALFCSKLHPKNTYTVIESSTIGIIGAGEGSTGFLTSAINNVMGNFGTDLLSFIKETGAGIKMGIKHKGWTPDIDSHYIGPIGGTVSSEVLIDYVFANKHITDPKNLHSSSRWGKAIDLNKSSFNKKTFKFDNIDVALHFDAHKVGKYFKKVTMSDGKVQHIDDEVLDVNLDEQGHIKSLLLKSKQVVTGDFFIDASGFRRVLMNKLGVKWVSYKENLPVNSAMPFLLDYEPGETPELYTTAWAQSSGWMWQIPVQERKGCGYVFDDRFITPDQAHAELEKTLGRKVDPIRVLKFDSGRLEKVWHKNCLAVGLAAAFAEPLEATSIHTTILQLMNFNYEFLRSTYEDTINPGSIAMYNERTAKMYDVTKEFLVAHYMGGRADSEFWKYIASGATMTPYLENLFEMCKSRHPSNHDFNLMKGTPDWDLWSYVLAGIGKLSPEVSKKMLEGLPEVERPNIPLFVQESETAITEMLNSNMNYPDFLKFIQRLDN